MKRLNVILLSLLACIFLFSFGTFAASDNNYTVEEVTALLESIDTLQQMQDKRSSYTVNKHYNANNASIVASHQKARNNYETYLEEMFAKRKAAEEAYNSLSVAEKNQIPVSLTSKLNNKLDTVLSDEPFSITKADNEYTYQLISPNFMVYEVSSSYIKTGDVAGTFVLVDTTTSGDTWTADGLYKYGEVNYDLGYCCDLLTLPANGTHYKITNLENSKYYDKSSAEKIRAITEISYPFLTIEEMKQELIKGGLDEEFVATLTRSDLITSVQMAIWAFANVNDSEFSFENVTHYGGTLRMKNHPYIPKLLHDYTNECWTWWSQKAAYRTFDERTETRVNRLVEHLCSLTPKEVSYAQTVITDLEVVKTELVDYKNDIYDITMYISLNGGSENDDLKIQAISYSENEDGTKNITETIDCKAVLKDGTYTFNISAKDGDIIEIIVEGNQMLPKGAYFYDAGSREISQAMVGITEGPKAIKVSKNILFVADMVKVPVEDIEITASEVTLVNGEKLQLAITVKPEDATIKEVTFQSSDETVATVDEKGNITTIAPGVATITITSVDNPIIKKEVIINVKEFIVEPEPEPGPVIPPVVIPRKHYIAFGKTDGIGWYEVSINGGDFFPQGPNSTLEVDEGSVLVVRVQDMGIDDEFDFYVNGERMESVANTITVVVDGYMLIGALSMDVDVPDPIESLNWFQRIIRAIKDFFNWLVSLFK